MSRNSLSLRTPGHVGQLLPKDIKNIELRNIIKNGGCDEGSILNMDETPLYLNMVPNKVIAQKGEKNVVIRTKIKKELE